MAAITWGDVLAIAPSLTTITETARADIVGHVNEMVAASEFGGEDSYTYRLARMQLAAHLGTLIKRGSAGGGSAATGAVVSESVGGISRSYAQSAASDDSSTSGLSSTPYGLAYLELLGASPASCGFVV